ncbi:MAG TPA: ATP-binding protein [Anaerolineales bacterium]|nr:ATP-binding protein [Anaerolineales bacterium]
MSTLGTQRRSPYQGLIPYDEDDTPFFFGREKEIRLIAANLFAAPLTLLYGASGVGKSSVLRAGVIPQLRQDSDLVVIMFNTWQGDVVNHLRRVVYSACPDVSLPSTASLSECLITCAAHFHRQIIVLLDQFEEYFLYHPHDAGEGSFAVEFARAVTQPNVPLSFLISIREDSLAKLDRFEGSISTLFDNYLRLEHLEHSAATEAIVKPVDRFNQLLAEPGIQFNIEPVLVEKVIEQVQTGQIVIGDLGRGQVVPRSAPEKVSSDNIRVETPYLQLVLTRLWDEEMKQNSHVLRLTTLSLLGGADQIIRTHLDEVMKYLKPDQQEVAAYLLHYLVTPSGSKIALSTEALAHFSDISLSRVENVVDQLAASNVRILRPVTAGETDGKETWYEIFHDALAPAVLDWCVRYFRRPTLLERISRPALGFVLAAIWLQSISTWPVLTGILRGSSLVILNILVVMQVYSWLYRLVRPKISLLSLAGLGGPNLGLLLGLLLPVLWYTSTKWPEGALGAITSEDYIKYLFTLVMTLATALICFFGIMQGAGQFTYRFFKRFDSGFYGAYFAICILIIILIILNLTGVISPWIAF